jgi:stage II sporulation protein D
MKRFYKISSCIIFLMLFLFTFFGNTEDIRTATNFTSSDAINVRVRLNSGVDLVRININKGNYKLIDQATGLIIGEPTAGTTLTIGKKASTLKVEDNYSSYSFNLTYKGPLILKPTNYSKLNIISYENKQYRDTFKFYNESEGILVVNELDLEKYLYGVVGSEIGAYAELEALKAQAVVSRTYTLSVIDTGKKYDVNRDVSSQLYNGYSAEIVPNGQRVVEAIDATRGEIILYDNQIIQAVFHSNSGGYTANSENVWSASLPYLRATPSPYDIYALEFPTQTNGWPANTYKWEKRINLKEAKEIARSYNSALSSIGNITNFSLSSMDSSINALTECGRVTEMRFHGTNGSKSVFKDEIRNVFGLQSTKFDIKTDSTVYIKDGFGQVNQVNSTEELKAVNSFGEIKSLNINNDYVLLKGSNKIKKVPKVAHEIVFEGYGNGHGVGMSQWGARGMAASGYNYRQIIEHYYNQGKNDGRLQVIKYY